MPISHPDRVAAVFTAPAKLLPAVQKVTSAASTQGSEYGGLKDTFEYGGKGAAATHGFEVEDRKPSRLAAQGFEEGGKTPKK